MNVSKQFGSLQTPCLSFYSGAIQRRLTSAGLILLAATALNTQLIFAQGGGALATEAPGQPAAAVLNGSAQVAGPYDPNQMMRLVFALQPPHPDEEKQFVRDVQTKGSPVFHQFLTPSQWNARFAPAPQDEQAIVDWAQSQGLTVTNRYPNRLIVNVEAPAGIIQTALKININNYRIGSETFYSNDRNPTLPANLQSIIQAVMGLNSLAVLQPASFGAKASPPVYVPGPLVTRGPSFHADASAPKGLTVPLITQNAFDPSDIYNSNAYNYAPLNTLSKCCNPLGNPSGPPPETSIGIATAYDINLSDLNGFQAQYPYLAPNVNQVFIGGAVSCPGSNPTCNLETTLDIEWSTATSNSFNTRIDSAAIWAYQGSDALNSTFITIFNQMLKDDYVRVVSTSWGCNENCYGTSGINAADSAFLQMVGQGWTVVAASGDNGAADGCGPADAVNYPASDPNVVAVGGTTLQWYTNGTYDSEVGWTGGTAPGSCTANNGGSGGGISSYLPAGSYQTPLGFTNRGLPDVALNASSGQNIYYNGALQGVGGTSIAAPEIAGFMAQENSYLLSLGSICGSGTSPCAPMGNANYPMYYEGLNPHYASHYPFYDILTGCNSNDITLLFSLNYFCATTGYDLVTGWGSANMLQLAWAINTFYAGDAGAPAVKFSGPPINHWYNKDETVSWTIADTSGNGFPANGVAGFSSAWDSDPGDVFSEPTPGAGNSFYIGPTSPHVTTGSLDFVGSAVSQACHTVNVRAWDNAGVPTGDLTYGPVCYDTVPPLTTISYQGTKSGNAFLGSVQITLTPTDNASGIAVTSYKLDGGPYMVYLFAPFIVSTPGNHTIKFYSSDVAGNVEIPVSSNFSIVNSTTTAITSSPNPSTYGELVTFTATVTAASGAPTGTVKFSNGITLIGSGAVSGGVATFTTSALAAGTYSITATYGGSTTFAGSSSPALTQTVNKASTSTTLVSSPNPSNAGQLVTFTATVTSAGGIPSRTVSFYSGSTLVGSGTLSGGVATFATSSFAAGNYRITATYTGSADFNSSFSSPLTQIVDSTSLPDTSTSLASSEPYNPFGHAITLTATVTSASGTPTGRVTFYNGRTTLGSGQLSGGVATLSTSTLPAGTDIITATYGGSATFNSSTSAPFTQLTLGVYFVGNSPEYIISDGTNMWVSNSASNTVSKLRTSDGTVLATIGVGVNPQGLAFDGTNIWVANGSNTVTLLNASTGNGVVNYSAGPYPGALAFDGTHIWVASHEYNVLTELQASNGAVVNTFTFGPANLSLGAILFDGTYIWLTYGSSIAKLQASTGALLGTFSDGTVPGAMAFDGTHIWVANYGAGSVSKLLASTGAVEATYPVSSPSGLVFDGTNIWVSNYMNATVTQLRASDGTSQGSYMVGAGPVGLAFDGANVWVAVAVTDTVCKF